MCGRTPIRQYLLLIVRAVGQIDYRPYLSPASRQVNSRISLATPRKWWNKLDQEFHFTLDAAADGKHHMTRSYFSPRRVSALMRPWSGRVWCSPPWSEDGLGHWLGKARAEAEAGNAEVVVMLLPVRPTSEWWQEHALKSEEIRFIDGTLKFKPFDSNVKSINIEAHCLVIFRGIADKETRMKNYPAR